MSRTRKVTGKCNICGRIIIAQDRASMLSGMANHKLVHKGQKKPDVAVVTPRLDAPRLQYKVISDTEIKLTKAKAYEFLELPTFSGERHVTDSHVQKLYEAWKSGRFMWEHVIIAACVFNGKTYRINGQHTCWMRVNIDGDDGDFKVRTIFYAVDTEEDMRALYSTFDQNKTRSAGHIVRVLLTGTNAGKELWSSSLGLLASGLKVWLFEGFATRISAQAVSALIDDKYSALFQTVGLYFQTHYKSGAKEFRFLRRSAVLAALFATFNTGIANAREFWDPVITGLGLLKANDPRHQLRKFITSHSHAATTIGAKDPVVSPEDMYRVCISAWNKWKKGEMQEVALRALDKRPKVL